MISRVVLTSVFALTLALLTRVPIGDEPQQAAIRLSWRHVGAQIVKKLSAEELEALPPHMRPQDGVAESQAVDYLLEVTLDGQQIFREQLHPGGLRRDRPIFVFHRFPVEPGKHRLKVVFKPEASEVEEAPLELDAEVELEAGQIVTVGIERDARGPRLSTWPKDR